MIDNGVIVALGSDFNPNAHCLSMVSLQFKLILYINIIYQPLVMHLACVNMKMSMSEALAAATINAAYSLGKSSTHGSLEIEKRADAVVISNTT